MPDRRLLCLIQLPPPVHGTTVINAQVAASELLRQQFDVDILPLQFADSVNDIGQASPKKLREAARVAVKLALRLAKTRPDAVYFTIAPTGNAFLRDCVFVAIIKAFGAQRIYHVHGKGIANQTNVRWRRALYRWFFRDARVIHLSPLLAYDIADVEPADVKFVANGVVPSSPVVAKRANPRVRFLYLSNLAREKGHLVLVEALGILKARGADFEAVFVGADAGDGSLAELHARVQALGLAKQVRYLGPQYGAAKHEILATSDVLVFPTFYRQEAFPLVILEAMQYGLAVVSTFEAAIPEIVVEGETGLLVKQRDPEELADALEKLAKDPAAIARMGAAGRERFASQYTSRHLEQRLVDVLTSWLPA